MGRFADRLNALREFDERCDNKKAHGIGYTSDGVDSRGPTIALETPRRGICLINTEDMTTDALMGSTPTETKAEVKAIGFA
jgi:hypothetical protein